jgi:L-iditol 2-dehydrogenase
VRVIAIGKRKSQMKAAERLGATAAFDVDKIENPVELVRQLTDGGRGADSVIEAVGRAITWEWALQMVRKGGTVNLFGGCPTGTEVKIDPAALHYSEITIKSTFHHTPQFMREAMDTIARGEIRSSDFITGEVTLEGLPKVFQDMKNRNGELKTAVIP